MMKDILIKANKDYCLKLIYKDSEDFVIDITGSTARLMMRRSMYSDVLFTVDAVINGLEGEIVFNFEPHHTANVLGDEIEERLMYDVELTGSDGKKVCLLEGEAVIRQSITRD